MSKAESPLTAFSDGIAELVTGIAPSVVAVQARRSFYSSGVLWKNGVVVSSAHTIRRDEDIGLTLAGGNVAKGKLVGKDAGTDLAVISFEPATGSSITNAANDGIRVGDVAMIVGRSPNSGPNASFGIVSAVSGPWRSWRGGQLDQYIRLDATLFAGSSGGAVIDQNGRVVGIATNALSRVAGLAVPSSTVNRVVEVILKRGSVPTAYLGVGLHPVPVPESLQKKLSIKNSQGLMILAVDGGGPAESAGILIGDIVIAVEGTSVDDIDHIQSVLGPDRIGKSVRFQLLRGGELKDLAVNAGRAESGAMTVPENFGEMVEQLRRSTVVIVTRGRGGGSGIVVEASGVIVTNAHVVPASNVQVQLWDGSTRDGRVIASGGGVDLAILMVAPGGLIPASLENAGAVRPGDFVVAVGNPFGFIGAVTTGVVKRIGTVRGLGDAEYLQSAIRLAPGNSGGPLANASGEMIGVNSMVVGNTALAIPSLAVREYVNRTRVETSLGVIGRKVPLLLNGTPRVGLVLLEIQRGSSAEVAALLPGDIIVGVNDQAFLATTDIDAVFKSRGERMLKVQFVRGDRSHMRNVAVVLHPQRSRAA